MEKLQPRMKIVAAYKEQNPYWTEHPPVDNIASVFDHMNALTKAEAAIFGRYMNGCYMLTDWVSPKVDPVDPSVNVHSNTYTDGRYFWNGMLTHFVERYQADLPHEFKIALKEGIKRGGPVYEMTEAEYADLDRKFVDKVNSGEYGSEYFVAF